MTGMCRDPPPPTDPDLCLSGMNLFVNLLHLAGRTVQLAGIRPLRRIPAMPVRDEALVGDGLELPGERRAPRLWASVGSAVTLMHRKVVAPGALVEAFFARAKVPVPTPRSFEATMVATGTEAAVQPAAAVVNIVYL